MLISIKEISGQTNELLFPPKVETISEENVVAAIRRHQAARIAKLATFIFSTVLTLTATVLTEAFIITGMMSLPILLVSILSWGIFFRLYRLENRYLENVDDLTCQNFAKSHLESVLFEMPLETIENLEQIDSLFLRVNTLLNVDLFTEKELERFAEIQLADSAGKTLFQIAQEQNIDLSLHLQREKEDPGYFGNPPCRYQARIEWDGIKEHPIVVEKTKHQQAEATPDVESEQMDDNTLDPQQEEISLPQEVAQPTNA